MPDDPLSRVPPRSTKLNEVVAGNAATSRVADVVTTQAGQGQRSLNPADGLTTARAKVFDTTRLSSLLDKLRPLLPREFRVEVRRPDDLAVFDVILQNLRLGSRPGQAPSVERTVATSPAVLIVELPAQSFGEEAFLDATGPEVSGSPSKAFPESNSNAPKKNVASAAQPVPPLPSSRIRMAGKSRLAFTMPADVASLPLTLEAIMAAIRTWPERRDVLAQPDPSRFRVTATAGAANRWLQALTDSPEWKTNASSITTALQTQFGADTANRVADAANRIGLLSSAKLTAGVTEEETASAIEKAVTDEVGRITANTPALQTEDAQSMIAAAVSVQATESLAKTATNFGDEISAVQNLPFLPFLLFPHKPSNSVTALELPYRLIVTPIESAHWQHRDLPFQDAHSGRTELWHTRLTTSTHPWGPDAQAKIRAIWSPDYELDPLNPTLLAPPLPFRMSLDALDRKMLVRLMAGYQEIANGTKSKYSPLASRTDRLMLSSLGALLDAEGSWDKRPGESRENGSAVGLEQWRHIATLGRDQYVRVVYAGFLMPFGHHASLIKVTERKFESVDNSLQHRIAVLRQRFFIVVREHVKSFPNAGSTAGWFDFPFNQVEVLTNVTPNLDAPDQAPSKLKDTTNTIYSVAPPRAAFWPSIGSSDFQFQLAATDICGNRITFSMPLLFVGDEANSSDAAIKAVLAEYDLPVNAFRRVGPPGGATVCFAPKKDGSQGDPNLPAQSITYNGTFANRSVLQPRFDPHIETAQVGIRQVQRLLGKANAAVQVSYPDVYKASGFGGTNPGEVFLKLAQPLELAFGGDASQAKSDALGALASPAMAIQGLSRIMGPVAAQPPIGAQTVENALSNVIGNKFDPTDFFKGAKILGGIDLSTILEVATALVGGDVPKLLSRDLPDRVEASFDWQTEIKKSDPLNLLVPTAGGAATILSMTGKMVAPIANPQAATFEANAKMTNFKVNLFGFIIIWFDSLNFKAARGKKPDVAVDMHEGDDAIVFGGPLEFVNDLRKFIPSNGFSDPPSLSVTPSGISASYSLTLPNIEVGIFALSNVSIGAGFSLPFDASPMEVKFNFSERQSPFSLTISLLGGGGFFAIGIGAEGVREIEAALEFGAELAIDLGVASGSVEIKAGVYFHWIASGPQKSVELSGYVRLHGELSVLGLISASLTFNLQLGYTKQGSKSSVWGEAELTVEIDILFFSASVSVKCRREFGGSPADPKFVEGLPQPSLWADYCGAFAAE